MTFLKHIILKGTALSLICIPTLVEATITVTSPNDSGPGTLRNAISRINRGQDNTINFDSATVNDIRLLSPLPILTRNATITGNAGLKVHFGNTATGTIFQVNANLVLIGNNNSDGATSNWYGGIQGMGSGGSVIFQQQVPSIYPGQITGPLNIICQAIPNQNAKPLTLSNTSSYSGATSIIGTTLNTTISNALPAGTSVNVTRAVNINASLVIGDGCTQTIAGLTGNSFVGIGNINNNSALTIASATNSTFDGTIRGPGKLTKQGPATFELTNNNSYTGSTKVDAGVLLLSAPNNTLPATNTATISDNATLAIANNSNQTLQSISGDGETTIGDAGSLTAAITINDATFTGDIAATGTGTFIKTGTKMLTLSTSKANTGNLVIQQGGIKIPTGGSWKGPIQITAGTTPTLEMNGGIVTQTITGDATVNSILNITDIFTPTIPITDVGTINVNTGGHFTINPGSVPTGFTNFTVNTGGTTTLGTNFTVPATATLTNTGTFAMNSFNLIMGDNSVLNSGTFVTTGSIAAASGIGYALNVQAGETLTVNNPITGYTALTVADGGSIVLNSSGNLSNDITLGNSAFTVNGGSYSGNVVGAGGSTMNVNSSFTQPGTITVDSLNINTGTTFIPNTQAITTTTFNVRQGGTLLLTNDLSGIGTIVNAGAITHTANTTRTITGNFTQEATGTINIGITSPQQYSQLQVNGNTILNGGTINIGLLSNAMITNGQVFNIITSTGAITNNILPTVSKPSLFLGFTPVVNGNTLQLIANRTPYKFLNSIPALDGTAAELDNLCISNSSNPLVGFVDKISSQSEFETLLSELAPAGLNGIYTTPGLGATEQILLRLDTLRGINTTSTFAKTAHTKTGYAAGDMGDIAENQSAFGPIFFENSTKQGIRDGLLGYNALTTGFGLVGDTPILEHFRIGLGASYANSTVKQSNNTGSNTTIANTQGMAYGSATYDQLFLDAVLSAGINKYHGKRNLTFFGQTATSAYTGFQYGTKIKTGFTIPCQQIEIAPTAALQYMHLRVGKYTEQGAPSKNQSVDAMQFDTIRTYLGGKMAYRNPEKDFFPEIHAFYIIDIRNPNVQITARFVDGGGSFVSTAVRPPKYGVNVGASMSGLICNRFVVSGGYDFEGKKSLKSHSLSLKFKYLF